METVSHVFSVYGNIVEITPDNPIQDNSIYEIRIKGIKPLGQNSTAQNLNIKVQTRLTPIYCTIEAVKSLVEDYNIEEDRMLYFMREASLFAEYVKKESYANQSDVPFEVVQYVKYKSAYDSLLKFYIEWTTTAGQKGTIGEISFENPSSHPAIKELLKALKLEVDKWEEYLRGYGFEGRAKPTSAVRSIKYNPAGLKTSYATFLTGYSRGVSPK